MSKNKKRTPISGEKEVRLKELDRLKAAMNVSKTSLPKAKQKLEFHQSSEQGYIC